jgi:uncharacterized membrane protein
MTLMLIGLLLFLGTHSVRIVAEPWRSATRERIGPLAWRGIYSVLSIAGFVAIVWGYGIARQQPVVLWEPPLAMRHIAALLTLVAFVLLAAAYVPGNAIKARLGHPMAAGVKIWAFAHLLANGTLADALLFGAFLAWAVLSFRASRARDRASGTRYAAGGVGATALAVAAGVLAWAGFAFWAHAAWIGVRPFG